ncbi:hypothetical protein [Paenibacillus sp. MBLB4367]|uniref:hypothetical protein n=1 Tax=Paenibacillus sp. MBLB4367 TaxID=3384767 RepID=UPI0039081212
MPDSISLGPLQLQWSLLSMLLSVWAGYALVSLRLKREDRLTDQRNGGLVNGASAGGSVEPEGAASEDGDEEGFRGRPIRSGLMNILANGLFVVLLFWKFGFLLQTPAIIWEQPLGLLIYWSSADMVALGVVAAGVLVLAQLRRAGIAVQTAVDAAAFGVLASYAVRQAALWSGGKPTDLPWAIAAEPSLTGVHPIGAYTLLLSLVLGLWLWNKRDALGSGTYIRDVCTFGGLGLLALSLLEEPSKGPVFLLTAEQWGYAALVLVGNYASRLLALIQFPSMRHTKASGAEAYTTAKEQEPMAQNDSKAQIKQERQNEAERNHGGDAADSIQTDKKLNGPNRPST